MTSLRLSLVRFSLFSACGVIWAYRPDLAPVLSSYLLVWSLWPIYRAWRVARGLPLRPAVVWLGVAVALGLMAQVQGLGEPAGGGRPIAGHWAYISSLATLAGLISILGARTPGGGAWAMLTGLLVLVFLLPWLEGVALSGGAGGLDRLRLDTSWSIFYAVLGIAGVTNFLTTRYVLSSALIAASLTVELVGLHMTSSAPSHRATMWSLGPALLAMGLIQAYGSARSTRPAPKGLNRLWLWFRDHWGVVWALRVRERFNRAAEASRWPIRLSWHGATTIEDDADCPIPVEALLTLKTLLRRFADVDRLDRASGEDMPRTCRAETHEG